MKFFSVFLLLIFILNNFKNTCVVHVKCGLNYFFMYTFLVLQENNQIPSYHLEIENDNRPDEDKIFESLPIEVSFLIIDLPEFCWNK